MSAPTTHRISARSIAAVLFSAALALALVAPSPALAKRAPTDEIAGSPLSASSVATAVAPDISAPSGILTTGDGRTLWARSPGSSRPMASITKLMTALLVLEHGGLDEVVTVSKAASSVNYASGLKPGERVSVRSLLEYALVASSNDSAYALGEYVDGTMPAFVAHMNARARALGLEDTHFANAHGLDESGHQSSAEDIATLAQTLMRMPEFRRIELLREVTLPPFKDRPARKLEATDKLLGVYDGLCGGKTGFTNDAKYCFVASAERDGIALIAVVLGAKDSKTRFTETQRLLNWGYKHYRLRDLAPAAETFDKIPLAANPERSVPVCFESTPTAAVFDFDGEIEKQVSLVGTVRLPVFKGQPLGQVTFVQGERELAKSIAVAAAPVVSAEENVGAVPVSDYVSRTVAARTVADDSPVATYDTKGAVERTVNLHESVPAPVAEGTELGEVVYTQGGRVLARAPVVAAEAVAAPNFIERIGIVFVRGWRMVIGAPPMAQVEIADA